MQQQAAPAFAIFDDCRPTVTITVIIRWLLLFAWLAMTNYRQDHDADWVAFNLMGAGMGVANAYLSWQIVTNRPIGWHHALALSLMELAVIATGLYILNWFQNRFYVFYYPARLFSDVSTAGELRHAGRNHHPLRGHGADNLAYP